MIRIGVVDDHHITRAALMEHFSAPVEFRVVGEAVDAGAAVKMALSGSIDVLVLDLQLGKESALPAIVEIVAKAPEVKILVLSGMPEEVYGPTLLAAGATGFLSKSCAVGDIITAVRNVAKGIRVSSATTKEALGGSEKLHLALSRREMELFLALAKGARLTEVAAAMDVSIKTASTYRSRVLEKMKMPHNSAMTHYALAHGLIT